MSLYSSPNLKNNQLALRRTEWILQSVNGLPLIFSPLLAAQVPLLTHAFTTRLGGKSEPPYDSFNLGGSSLSEIRKQDALSNRQRLCAALNLSFDQLVIPGQIHSANVVFADKLSMEAGMPTKEADGVATNSPAQPMLLHFADCVPIIILDPNKKACAVVHAGWRGTASQIVRQAVKFLEEHYKSKAQDLIAAVGPAIGSCCYPTGSEVVNKLLASVIEHEEEPAQKAYPEHNPKHIHGKPSDKNFLDVSLLSKIHQANLDKFFSVVQDSIHPDLKAINALQLAQSGVEKIDIANLCTACNPELFYSHRQSGGTTGRQGAIACLVQ